MGAKSYLQFKECWHVHRLSLLYRQVSKNVDTLKSVHASAMVKGSDLQNFRLHQNRKYWESKNIGAPLFQDNIKFDVYFKINFSFPYNQ